MNTSSFEPSGLGQRFSHSTMYKSPNYLAEMEILSETGLKWDQRFCISKKFPSDTEAAGPRVPGRRSQTWQSGRVEGHHVPAVWSHATDATSDTTFSPVTCR